MGVTRPIRWLIRWLVRIGAVVLLLTVAAVVHYSDKNLKAYRDGKGLDGPVEAVLVLGGGMDGDGLINFSSRRRARGAVALLESGMTQWVIFSGGSTGWGGPTEADLMRDFALGLGAPPEKILIESGARSTVENLRFGFSLARAKGIQRIAILTDAFHTERARRLAGYVGEPDVGLVAVAGLRFESAHDRAYVITREAIAWWYNLARIGVWEATAMAGLDRSRGGVLQ